MYNKRMQRKFGLLLLLGGVLAAGLWLGRLCLRADQLTFLPRRAPAEWLVYPKPPGPHLQAVAELPTTFRRSFQLSHLPASATLTFCACRHATVLLNGKLLPIAATDTHWKEPRQLQVAPYLRSGENLLSVTVVNSLGPPALWLDLQGDGLRLASDAAWEASYAGAVWRPAQLATQAQPVGPGSPFRRTETPIQAFTQHGLMWGSVALLSALLVGVGRWWFRHAAQGKLPPRWKWTANPATALLGLLALLWVLLFLHNLVLVPRSAGFDADGHLEYIHYLQQHGALPWADEGWEMHQPPLYYLLGATVLGALRFSALSNEGLAVLRLLGLVIGLAHLVFVRLSLRLLFPASPRKQAVGLAVAGGLPMQLYLAQYVTNEMLAACLMSATLYGILRLVLVPQPSGRLFLGVGLALGLALLTKVTALVLVPFVLAALVYRLLVDTQLLATPQEPSGPTSETSARSARWAGPVMSAAACLAVCGWHYWRVWRHFGHAFFVPTRWSYAVGWWQDPGYHTAAYFTHFGNGLSAPFFSGLSSLGDGLYTTLWGDGLCGGAADMLFRPPWNYELMAGGFLLALLPTVLIALGTGAIILGRGGDIAESSSVGAPPRTEKSRTAEQGSPRLSVAWLGLLGFALAMLFAIVHLNLEVPGFAEAKAIFGLSALIPLCALAAAGWGVLFGNRQGVSLLASVGLCIWALTSFASYWVRPDSAATQAALGRAWMNGGNLTNAVAEFQTALQREPHQLAASSFLVSALLQQDQVSAAAPLAQQALEAHPDEAICHLDLAAVLERQGQLEQALAHTQRAVELAPNSFKARLKLASRLSALRRLPEAIAACREALRLEPADPDVHYLLASSLTVESRRPDASLACAGGENLRCGPAASLSPGEVLAAEAMNHFVFVLRLAPDTVDALNLLSWALATHPNAQLRDGQEALRLAERACLLTKDQNPTAVAALAAAYAETGQFALAVPAAAKAVKLAEDAHDPAMLALTRQLQTAVAANQPFRQTPPPGH